MRAFAKTSPGYREALDRVREWTRARFALGEDTAILVAEVACAVPGCPPLETVVAFWSDERLGHIEGKQPAMKAQPDGEHQREGEEEHDPLRTPAQPQVAGAGHGPGCERQQHEPAGLCFFSSAGTHDT